jgi:hypothetical protein
VEIRIPHTRIAHRRIRQIRTRKIRPFQMDAVQMRIPKIYATQVDATEIKTVRNLIHTAHPYEILRPILCASLKRLNHLNASLRPICV